jgi:uncharacterized membrane protein YkoI
MTSRNFLACVLAALSLAALSLAASAAVCAVSVAAVQTAPVATRERLAIALADNRMSMDQAVKMAEQKFKARVVKAEMQDQDGKTIYVLRMLNDSGRVWTVRVDASTGTVI